MFPCPSCQNLMEEMIVYRTACCDAPLPEDETDLCPICGEEEPELIEEGLRLVCLNCGHNE